MYDKFNRAEWKRERFHLSEGSSLFEKPFNKKFNKHSILFNGNERNLLEIYKNLLEMRLEDVKRVLRKFDESKEEN